eukprot:TRINITY_DN5553_c0_g1_i1.p1 TRINITY_DN5553_c0_g1~~TRINITY_DN5553_c0_g1_i1.p1  ORF type:complete len:230 (+),score=43.84 TRINITY_DN5553_c0_g1_i1:158-847(+)
MEKQLLPTNIISKSHLCRRKTNCACQSFITSSLSTLLADNSLKVLSSEVLHQAISVYCACPEVHLPFSTFLNWMQTELYLAHYSACEKYIRIYLSHSKQRGGEFALPENEYQELMEILVFHCIYIHRGYDSAKDCIAQDQAMSSQSKAAFMQRLNEIDGRPLEVVKEMKMSSTQVKEKVKVFVIKHKWKLFLMVACLALWMMVKARVVDKGKLVKLVKRVLYVVFGFED